MSNSVKTATYDAPLLITFSRALATLNSAAEKARFRGPIGLRGKVVSVQGTITTSVTTAAAPLKLGSTTDDDAYLTTSVPVGVAPLGFQATLAQIETGGAAVDQEIPANTDVVVTAGGAAGAGAATVEFTIAWYK